MIRGKTLRGTAAALVAVFVMALAAPASATDSLLLSLLLPGLGQAQDGHYAKASIFGSAALISWVGLFATQVNYSSSVTRYENEKRTYLAYQDQLDRGEVVFIGDIQATYDNTFDDMHEATHAMIDAFSEIRTAAGDSGELTPVRTAMAQATAVG